VGAERPARVGEEGFEAFAKLVERLAETAEEAEARGG
jgi:hypothetical protein